MRLEECPRCEERTYEILKTHAFCHDCNFNSVEGFTWMSPIEPTPINEKPNFDEGNNIEKILSKLSSKQKFIQTDYEILRKALEDLTPKLKQVVFLTFWRGMEPMRAASFLGMKCRTVEAYLREAYHTLKKACLVNPQFSRYEATPSLTPMVSANAAA